MTGGLAVITGAAGGIGRALALEAASRGMAVAICDMDADGLDVTRLRVAERGADVSTHVLDVRDRRAIGDFAASLAVRAPIVRLFANAGILRPGSLANQPPSEIDLMIDVNLTGTLNCIQAFLPRLIAAGQRSRIVITGSQASLLAYPRMAAYCASKHALWGLADALREDLADRAPHIGVSLLCPGAVATPMTGNPVEEAEPPPGYLRPDAVARIVHDGADSGQDWIFTHPAFRVAFEARIGRMIEVLRSAAGSEQQFGARSASNRGLAKGSDRTD
jgi:NAD(P)-dependent dehydrogenase (short-subunit alcohol dehydrogenase family)